MTPETVLWTARRAPRDGQGGFTLAMTMMVLLVLMSLGGVAVAAATGDLRLNQRTGDEKRAFEAAEAGVAFFSSRLAANPGFFAGCGVGERTIVDQWDPQLSEADTRTGHWQALQDDPQSQYVVELLPARTGEPCDPSDELTLVRPDGTVRIRATGRTGPGLSVSRSVIATFRRPAFVDYLYFTDFEAPNPRQFIAFTPLSPTNATRLGDTQFDPPLDEWLRSGGASNTCAVHAQEGRDTRTYAGKRRSRGITAGEPGVAGTWQPLTAYPADQTPRCPASIGSSGDQFLGPYHTNDTVRNAGTAPNVYGRPGRTDPVEMYGSAGTAPTISTGATLVTGADMTQLPFPGADSSLYTSATAANRFRGKTDITFNGTSMTVVNGGTTKTMAIPANGVVAVGNNGACAGYDSARPYSTQSSPATCGQAWVSGTASVDVTVWADDDIVVTGDLRKSGNAVIGLVARHFVRVHQPVTRLDGRDPNAFSCSTSDSRSSNPVGDRRIDAAILSIEDSFVVDNFACGNAALGNLVVTGSIAQRYRGVIALSTGNGIVGYVKRYTYDDRLVYRAPPFFLAPEGSDWDLVREVEQVERS